MYGCPFPSFSFFLALQLYDSQKNIIYFSFPNTVFKNTHTYIFLNKMFKDTLSCVKNLIFPGMLCIIPSVLKNDHDLRGSKPLVSNVLPGSNWGSLREQFMHMAEGPLWQPPPPSRTVKSLKTWKGSPALSIEQFHWGSQSARFHALPHLSRHGLVFFWNSHLVSVDN